MPSPLYNLCNLSPLCNLFNLSPLYSLSLSPLYNNLMSRHNRSWPLSRLRRHRLRAFLPQRRLRLRLIRLQEKPLEHP